MILFKPEQHSYESLDPVADPVDWISATSLISLFKQPFDPIERSEKCSKNRKSKWYKMDPQKIRDAWDAEALRATTLGSWYHDQRETDLCSHETITLNDIPLKVIAPSYHTPGISEKVAPSQKLENNAIYPEHLMYLKSGGICGQSDRVDVINYQVDVSDYKTNKEIKTEAFKSWDGHSQRMLFPLNHLDDCNLWHYTLQLSIYMYMIIKHNPKLTPRKLTLQHVLFEEEGVNEFGYPITRHDNQGNPILKDVVPYEVPYLKTEVITLINHYQEKKTYYLDLLKKKRA